jgi:hypothetical protein
MLGANWLHSLKEEINPLYGLSKKLGLSIYETSSDDEPGDDILLYTNAGEKVSQEDYEAALKRYEWMKTNLTMFEIDVRS